MRSCTEAGICFKPPGPEVGNVLSQEFATYAHPRPRVTHEDQQTVGVTVAQTPASGMLEVPGARTAHPFPNPDEFPVLVHPLPQEASPVAPPATAFGVPLPAPVKCAPSPSLLPTSRTTRV